MATTSTPIPRPYRDYLVPRLHERFIKTALYTIPACYAASICMAKWGLLMWVPFGSTVLRTILVVVSVLMVLVVRISNLHIGARNSRQPVQTAAKIFWSFRWFHTLLWYSISAWLFSEVYIWSAGDKMALGWIDQGKSYERPKLNERPIYVRTIFFLVAVGYAALHILNDYDHTPPPTEQVKSDTRPITEKGTEPPQPSLLEYYLPFLQKGVQYVINSAPWRVGYLCLATFVYFLPLVPVRWTAVTAHRILAQRNPLWTLPKYGEISSFKEKGFLILATIFYGLVLSYVWDACNSAFAQLVVQPPLKNGKLITSVSPDPNSTLIVGLKAKRELVRNMAFWELALLTKDFPDRRKTIFAEFDRPGGKGSSWSSVSAACQDEINGISRRISPPAPVAPPPEQIQTLPRISDQGVQDENISTNPGKPSRPHQAAVARFAKSIGQSPGSPPPFVPQGQKLLASIPDSAAVRDIQAKRTNWLNTAVHSSFGWPFRYTFARTANAVVHGTPVGREWSIRNAATALSHLVIASLKEDEYGTVQKDVPGIIKTYVSNINAIERFLKTTQPHWTDVNFKDTDRHVTGVQETLKVLKEGLQGVLGAFGEYAQSIGLTNGDLAEARKASVVGGEMVERT